MKDVRTDYTRTDLIRLCLKAMVPECKWHDRDSSGAQQQVGKLWALLRAGCSFKIFPTDDRWTPTTNKTVWVEVTSKGFGYFEEGKHHVDAFYVPTRKRIREAAGEDWY